MDHRERKAARHGRKMNNQLDLFDVSTAKQLKDEGQRKVIAHKNEEWARQVFDMIKRDLPIGWLGIAEDIRGIFIMYYPEYTPTHSNAWGSVIKKAVNAGFLKETGKWRRSRSVKSRCARYPEYERR